MNSIFFFSTDKGTEDIINGKYYNIDETQSINNLNDKDALSLFSFCKY